MARTRAPHQRATTAAASRSAARRSPSRWLPVAIAAAVVLLVTFALGHASTGGDSSTNPRSPRSAIPGVGPSRTVHGVPAGYTHTRAGALAAALNYTACSATPPCCSTPRG